MSNRVSRKNVRNNLNSKQKPGFNLKQSCFSRKANLIDKEKDTWDLDEKKGFRSYKLKNKNYKLRNDISNTRRALEYISFINDYIKELIKCVEENIQLAIEKNCLSGAILLMNTPYTLQEIPKQSMFEGLNKPKGVYFKKCNLNTIMDNEYLASRRHIMLKLRTEQGQLLSWKSMKNLILHELSHTMCNHVIYRDSGNHQKKDFHKYSNFLQYISKKIV